MHRDAQVPQLAHARELLRRAPDGAHQFDAQWNDDAHHALHVLLTGECEGYYAAYTGAPAQHLARCLAEGFAYLAVVLDLFSRRVVGWSLAEQMTETLVLNALQHAIHARQPPVEVEQPLAGQPVVEAEMLG